MIIDTHVHIGGEALGFNMSEPIVEAMMEKYNIDYALISNCDPVEVDHSQNLIPMEYQVNQETALRRMLAFARKHPDKMAVAAWAKPYTQGITEEFEQIITDNLDIIKAIKLHPFHSNTSPIAPKCLPYLELAAKHNLAVVSHTGKTACDDPEELYKAALMFPNIPFVMVHMGLGTDNKKALDLLGKADNLYGDTTWVPVSTTIEALKRYGSSKILFGTDAPIDGLDTYHHNPKGELSLYQEYLFKLPSLISEDEYKDIMYRNAIRVLKLNI